MPSLRWLEFRFLTLVMVFLFRILYWKRSFSRLNVSVHILSEYRIFNYENTKGIDIVLQMNSDSNRNNEVDIGREGHLDKDDVKMY